MKRTGLLLALALAVVGLGFTQSASTGRIISEEFSDNGYLEATFYLSGEGNVIYMGFQSGRDAEIVVQIIRSSIYDGKAVVKNITASINPVIKKYMKDRNVRVMNDYSTGPFRVYIIRSTNPESFEYVTYRANSMGPPLFPIPEEGDPGDPPELPEW
jgi:hypothetical protein